MFYKQNDSVIRCVQLDNRERFLKVYPDCDVEIILCNEGENILAKFSFENEKIKKRISRLLDREEIEEIYHIIETKLTEDEDG